MDESWKPILKLFRIVAESRENMIIFGILVGILILVPVIINIVFYRKQKKKHDREEWEWFYRMAEAKDLSVPEMKLLRNMIKKAHIKNPTALFKSIESFDKCIEIVLRESEDKKEELLEDLSEIRKKLHFDRLPPKKILESTREIKPDQRIKIIFSEDGKEYTAPSKIMDVKEDSLSLRMPDKISKDVFQKGKSLKVYFWNYSDAGYIFSSKIKNIESEPQDVMEIEHSPDIERIQRRHYYRIDTSLPLSFRRLNDEQKAQLRKRHPVIFPENSTLYSGKVNSLSGGGISFISPLPLANREILWFELTLPEMQKISDIYGRVIKTRKISENKFKILAEFIVITEKARETIIGFVSREQRKRLPV